MELNGHVEERRVFLGACLALDMTGIEGFWSDSEKTQIASKIRDHCRAHFGIHPFFSRMGCSVMETFAKYYLEDILSGLNNWCLKDTGFAVRTVASYHINEVLLKIVKVPPC